MLKGRARYEEPLVLAGSKEPSNVGGVGGRAGCINSMAVPQFADNAEPLCNPLARLCVRPDILRLVENSFSGQAAARHFVGSARNQAN